MWFVTKTDCLGIASLTFPEQFGLSASSALMDELILSSWSSLHSELNHNPIKWCREEQSFHSFGFASQSLHPNPEEMGKWRFPACYKGQPWASRFVRTTKLRHTQNSFSSVLRCQKAKGTTARFKEITAHCILSHFLQQPTHQQWNTLINLSEE